MKLLLIGGTGFIGAQDARVLCALGHEVWVFHRGQTPADLPPEVRVVRGDRGRPPDLAALARLGPDVVIDVVPFTEREARDVAGVFRGVAGRLVALSSADVYRNYDGLRRVGAAAPD